MAIPAGVDLYVNENRILEPLDLVVLRDSRVDLFPRVKERVEEIPGRHGEVSFGSKLEPRILELHVVVKEEFTFAEREKKKREIAQCLNPTTGHMRLFSPMSRISSIMSSIQASLTLTANTPVGLNLLIPWL